MRPAPRTLPLLLLLAAPLGACSSTAPQGQISDPERMGRPLEMEAAQAARSAPEGRRPDENSSSRVLAYVDGAVVTYRDILLRQGPTLARIEDPRQRAAIEENALYDILMDRIVYSAAVQLGVDVTRDDLDDERAKRTRELQKNGGTLEAYLAERSMSRQEFDEMTRRSIITRRFMYSALGLTGGDPRVRPMADVFVSPSDVRSFWERHPEQFHEKEHAQFRMLVISTDLEAPSREAAVEAARAKAQAAHARLLAGEDWVPVYREFAAPGAEAYAQDGLRDIERGQLAEMFESFAFGNDRGTLVPHPVQVGTSFYVLRAEGRFEARTRPFEEVQEDIQRDLNQVSRVLARLEVELKLLERASIRPPAVAERLRATLEGERRKVLDEFGF